MRTLMALTLLASVASCGPLHPVFADEVCHKISAAIKSNPTWTHVEIQGTDKDQLLANYNASEPVTDYHADQVWVAYIKGNKTLHLMLVEGGCITFVDDIDTDAFFRMMTHTSGHPA